ncbi:hypothetical protein CQW23_08239 [Capsicum baccatum]|uniref:Uncharacterized protein n=1 Tax=Capsicum baccatum TaxID=33114 RepID=A0A2G2X8H8_CAPBA|nr:hypothetical protein CQW23_08239 [Capsicum baccatum]
MLCMLHNSATLILSSNSFLSYLAVGIQSQKVAGIGTLDASGRLVIVPDWNERFAPVTQSTNVLMESITSFYRDAWTCWRNIPVLDRDHMWNYFRDWNRNFSDYKLLLLVLKILLSVIILTMSVFEESAYLRFYVPILSQITIMWTAFETEEKPNWMLEDVWARLSERWKKSQTSDTQVGSSNQPSDDDEASILPEAIGGVKEGEAHNLGSQRCSACREEIDSLRRQVQKLSKKQKRDRLSYARLENLVQNLTVIRRGDEAKALLGEN